MLIRTQNKREIVNLDNVTNIHMFTYKNKKEIKEKYPTDIRYDAGANSGTLGTYSSEEKAIKVLNMIQETYEDTSSQLSANGLLVTSCKKVFNMPVDEVV